jgi:diguanylate cyclase (GGDEF)-like protein
VGDVVLREVAQRLARSIRSYDWAGRYGGEEFLVLLCNSNAEMMALCAERIRKDIASEPVRVGEVEVAVTVSIGTAFSLSDSLTCGQLIGIADSALYRAKDNGRNCFEVGLLDNPVAI